MTREEALGEVFNIGGDQEVSIRDLAELVRDLVNSNSEITMVPYDDAYEPGFEDMTRRVPNTDKLRALTGWEPEKSLQDIISDVIEHHRVIGATV